VISPVIHPIADCQRTSKIRSAGWPASWCEHQRGANERQGPGAKIRVARKLLLPSQICIELLKGMLSPSQICIEISICIYSPAGSYQGLQTGKAATSGTGAIRSRHRLGREQARRAHTGEHDLTIIEA
jgi:hypothetical protein